MDFYSEKCFSFKVQYADIHEYPVDVQDCASTGAIDSKPGKVFTFQYREGFDGSHPT